VSANVLALGFTSMFTDISSEMVGAVLPLYLTLQLGFTPLQFGAFDGVYQAVAAIAAIGTARLADRTFRHREFAGLGYGMSASTRFGFLLAGHTWAPATALLYVDRAGKGIRTAPRDALISLSSATDRLGEAFGVHRALDTVGALMGPLLAFLVLRSAPGSFDSVFVLSFCAAAIGLAILVLFVRDPAADSRREAIRQRLGVLAIFRQRGYGLALAAAVVLGSCKISDALIYLTFQRRSNMRFEYFPLLYVGTAVIYMLLAVPLGRLADTIGRSKIYLLGFTLLVVAYVALAHNNPGPAALITMLVALGGFYACTDGILPSIITPLLPVEMRTTGVALLNTIIAGAGFVSSVTFGALWSVFGPRAAVQAFTAALIVALAVAGAALLRRRR